ncbi:MAG: amidohydrolase [Anaerolineae bacterium]|nr:amidohydrolase [Anaerolineae bacterium]
MQIIDTHVHVWTHNPQFPWSPDTTVRLPQYDAHPEALLDLMQVNGIDRAVLTQFIGYRWDNSYVAHVLKSFPSKFIGVCRVNPEDPSAPDQLSYWTELHGFRGVRISPKADARGDWFISSLMDPLFRRAAECGIPMVVLTKPARLRDLANILDRLPDVDVIIDHMADCIDGNANNLQMLLALSKYPRVYLKMGHIAVNSSQSYPWRDTHDSLKQVYQVYGAERIMWGSDWPLSLSRLTYAQALSCVRDEMPFFSRQDMEWILNRTALRCWPFLATTS